MFNKLTHPLNNATFPRSREEWRKAAATEDDEGLRILGHPVMQRWELPYMAALARIAAQVGGRVLEVGFGLGLSATFLQGQAIDEHWIIEANEEVYRKLLKWACRARVKVVPLLGFWEDIAPGLPDAHFDGILFDPYPVTASELHTQRFSFFEEGARLLRPGGVFTHYAGEVEFTPEYRRYVESAGFRDYTGELVAVNPPAGCAYWNESLILAPVIRKQR